jgi:hypothetical protein
MSELLERLKQKPDIKDENLFILASPYLKPIIQLHGIHLTQKALELLKSYIKTFERVYGIRHPPVVRSHFYEVLKRLLPLMAQEIPIETLQKELLENIFDRGCGDGNLWQAIERLPYRLMILNHIDESLIFNKNGEYEPELFEE